MLYHIYTLCFSRKGHGYKIFADEIGVSSKTIKNKYNNTHIKVKKIIEQAENTNSPLENNHEEIKDIIFKEFEKYINKGIPYFSEEIKTKLIMNTGKVKTLEHEIFLGLLNGKKIAVEHRNDKKEIYNYNKIYDYVTELLFSYTEIVQAQKENNKDNYDSICANISLPFFFPKEIAWENKINNETVYIINDYLLSMKLFIGLFVYLIFFTEEYNTKGVLFDYLESKIKVKDSARKIFFKWLINSIYETKEFQAEYPRQNLQNIYSFFAERRKQRQKEKGKKFKDVAQEETIEKLCKKIKSNKNVSSNELDDFIYLVLGNSYNDDRDFLRLRYFLASIIDEFDSEVKINTDDTKKEYKQILQEFHAEMLEKLEEYHSWIMKELKIKL